MNDRTVRYGGVHYVFFDIDDISHPSCRNNIITISYFENESRGLLLLVVRSSIDFLSKSFHHQLLQLQQHQQRPSSPMSRNCQHCHNPTTTSVVINDKMTVIALISMGETATATYLAEWCIQSMRVDPFNSQLCNT